MKLVCIFLYFIILFVFVLFIYHSKTFNREGLNNYYDNRPIVKKEYLDKNGIEISKLGNYGRCLVINNEIQLCDKDEHIYHEMLVHFPFQYLRKNVQNVVIVGGGDLMTLREVMKYRSIQKVYILEISPVVVKICKSFFKQNDFKNNKKVKIIYGDANKTINRLLLNKKNKIDAVILDTTEDNTENLTIDTPDFFYKCFALLHDKGILVKNGLKFKYLFESYADLNTISYKVDIPYFQEKYCFTIASKPSNDIRKKNIEESRWNFYKIKTKLYKPSIHNSFILHEKYINVKKKDNGEHKFFFVNKKEKDKKLLPRDMVFRGDDIFRNLF